MKTIRVPEDIHEKLTERKTHKNQPFYEVIEELLNQTEPDSEEELFTKANSFLIKRGAKKVAIFGSRVKGEAQPDSDLDILVEFPEDTQMSLLDHAKMQEELSDMLGVGVDLVEEEELKPYIADKVRKEAKTIYERG